MVDDRLAQPLQPEINCDRAKASRVNRSLGIHPLLPTQNRAYYDGSSTFNAVWHTDGTVEILGLEQITGQVPDVNDIRAMLAGLHFFKSPNGLEAPVTVQAKTFGHPAGCTSIAGAEHHYPRCRAPRWQLDGRYYPEKSGCALHSEMQGCPGINWRRCVASLTALTALAKRFCALSIADSEE